MPMWNLTFTRRVSKAGTVIPRPVQFLCQDYGSKDYAQLFYFPKFYFPLSMTSATADLFMAELSGRSRYS